MADLLVLFASIGDDMAFKPIIKALEKEGIPYDFRMASAHKTPKDIEIILKKKYKVIITGAGLAAALPGVVAASVLCPVIGVPCSGNLEGLDALLSIMQMPPGIPVLTTGVDGGRQAAENAILMLDHPQKIVLGGEQGPAMEKSERILTEFGVPISHSKKEEKGAVTIHFISAKEHPMEKKGIVIYCPLIGAEGDSSGLALTLLGNTSHGLWVGLNNGTNAAIGAIEILNFSGKYTKKLVEYRKEQAAKVRAYNK